jgi:hypothetical protein
MRGTGQTAIPDRIRSVVAAGVGVSLSGILLAGCASVADSSLTVFADPGKYQYSNCEQLAGQRKHWSSREEELRLLMGKAEQSAGGAIVNVLAYKADHVAASEELKIIERAARSKSCDSATGWQSNSAVR